MTEKQNDIKVSPRDNHNDSILKESPHFPETYIPDHFPPNVAIAERHGLAKRVAIIPEFSPNDNLERCECCGLPIKNELFSLCCSPRDLKFLGPGFPLYFEFIMFCAFILGIMISVEGIYNIIANYVQGSDCDDTNSTCTRSNINMISLANKFRDEDLYQIQCWVNFGCAVAIMISLHFFRRIQRKTNFECDKGLISPSDYSLMISQIPSNDYTEEEIRELLLEFWEKIPKSDEENKKGFPVKKIVFSYKIGTYIELIRKKKALLLERRKALAYKKNKGSFPLTFNEESNEQNYKKTCEEIDKYEKEAEMGSWKEKCGIVIVSFNTEQDRDVFLERCTLTPFQKVMVKLKIMLFCQKIPENLLFFKGKFLVVETAPEPNDILWENLHYSTKYKIRVRSVIYSIALFILIFCFGIILAISFGQAEAGKSVDKQSYKLQVGISVLGVVVSFVIVFINTALTIILKKFGNLEKHSTLTHLSITNAIKLSLAQFFNTCILILVVKLIALNDEEENSTNLIFSSGYNISSDIVSIFCTNAIVTPVLNFLNPWYCLRHIKRRRILKEGLSCLTTQEEANGIFEGGDVDLAVRYSGLMKTVWLSGFYLPVTPIGAFISFFGVIFFYFVEKYLLLRRLSRPPLISSHLNEEMLELLEYVPLMMGFGSLCFHYILFDPTKRDLIPDLLTICLSGLNFILPAKKINSWIFPFNDQSVENKPYDEAKMNFPTLLYFLPNLFTLVVFEKDYDRANPVTQEAANLEWIKLHEGQKGVNIPNPLPNPLSVSVNETGPENERRINNCLRNYANANFQKFNNMIAQLPQNIPNQNLLPYFNVLQQPGATNNAFPQAFANALQLNFDNVKGSNHRQNESQIPEIMPLIIPNPANQIPILNVNYGNGAYPPPQQNQPYAFPLQEQIYPPNLIPPLPNPNYNQQIPGNPPFYNNLSPNPNYNDPIGSNYPSNMNIPQEYNSQPQYGVVYRPNPGGIPNLYPNSNYTQQEQRNPQSNYISENSQKDHQLPPPSMIYNQQYGNNNNIGNYQ